MTQYSKISAQTPFPFSDARLDRLRETNANLRAQLADLKAERGLEQENRQLQAELDSYTTSAKSPPHSLPMLPPGLQLHHGHGGIALPLC